MTDREERQHVIEVLKSWDGYFIGYTSDEVQEALRYAIASIRTDLKYDLLYEEALEEEPIKGHCKNCKFFELNSWAACGGIPIIVAHEICKAWGKGCKTKEDGYCFLFESKSEVEK